MTSSDLYDPLPLHRTYLRPGEVTLFLKPRDSGPRNQAALNGRAARQQLAEQVTAICQRAKVELSPANWFDPSQTASQDASGADPGQPRLIQRDGQVLGVLQTVRLLGWIGEDERRSYQARHDFPRIGASIASVGDAVRKLNAPEVLAGDPRSAYRLAAASPNWLALPFPSCGGGCGSPAGRPVRPVSNPLQLPRFRPDKATDARAGDQIGAAVKNLLGEPPARGADGSEIEVAIFDAWPMEPAPRQKRGQPAVNPLGLIETFLANALAAGAPSTGRLTEAATGKIVPADRIYDYVTCTQPGYRTSAEPGGIPSHPQSGAAKDEEPYDMSNHGLFIADIINDIAPGAYLSVYRVLCDEGTGDMETIIKAVQDAIDRAAAAGRRLVLNLSLGFAPRVLMIDTLLNNLQRVYFNPPFWWDELKTLAPAAGLPSIVDQIALLQGHALVTPDGRMFQGSLGVPDAVFSLKDSPAVLGVAAAGNDSAGSRVFGPRVPAAVEGMLAISGWVPTSGTQDWARAPYSNDDDFFTDNDGIGAFGGLVAQAGGAAGPETEAAQALVGLYVGPDLPPGSGASNDVGLAAWSGTSFAAPIAAGFAAAIWSERTSLIAQDVRGYMTQPDPSQDREYLNFRQV